MNAKTTIDLRGHIRIPIKLRNKYGLQSRTLADVLGTADGLLVTKTDSREEWAEVIDDLQAIESETSSNSNSGDQTNTSVSSDWGVEYIKETDTLVLGQDLTIERAAEKLRSVLYPMLAYLNELDDSAVANSSLPVLEDITRLSSEGEIILDRQFRYRYGLHPNAEVEISDTGEGLLIRKTADSRDAIDRVTGSLPPGNVVEQLGGTDAYMRWIRGG